MARKYKRSKRGTFAYDGGRKRDTPVHPAGSVTTRGARGGGKNALISAVSGGKVVNPGRPVSSGELIGVAGMRGARVRTNMPTGKAKYVSVDEFVGRRGGRKLSRTGARALESGGSNTGDGYLIHTDKF